MDAGRRRKEKNRGEDALTIKGPFCEWGWPP
jgi:hypothetical protein